MTSLTVVKLGGSTLGQHDTSLDDIAVLHREGRAIVVVHGGGATISEWLDRHGIESRFVGGLRVTGADALEVVVAVLAGLVNKRLVAELQSRGVMAVGLSGVDGRLLQARRFDEELGFVGEISNVDAAPLKTIIDSGAIAVVAPIAIESGSPQLLNINADTAAGRIACEIGARRLVFLTDVEGVLDASSGVIARLTDAGARDLLTAGTVAGGMIPKVEAAVLASTSGVRTLITDGRRQGALRAAFEESPAGTLIASGSST